MKGLYIHIPFCRQACRYCDFYFTVSLRHIDVLADCIVKEIRHREVLHGQDPLETLYLGGGTPSVLSRRQIEPLLEAIHRRFSFSQEPEITMECNPDDLNRSYLQELAALGFNRLSIGIQSFHDSELALMRRSHTPDQAEKSVLEAAEAGFSNISVDLIYGVPGQDLRHWEDTLKRTLALPVTHLSAYHLTYEPGTVFDHWKKKGRLVPLPEATSLKQYAMLLRHTGVAGLQQYEISNFARQGSRSRHNQLYWTGEPYMGAGPSAHSYTGTGRRWNVSHLGKYMKAVQEGNPYWEEEHLTTRDRFHDYLITSLRTLRGADLHQLEREIGTRYVHALERKSGPFLKSGSMVRRGNRLIIPPEHWLITDHILRELFLDDGEETER